MHGKSDKIPFYNGTTMEKATHSSENLSCASRKNHTNTIPKKKQTNKQTKIARARLFHAASPKVRQVSLPSPLFPQSQKE